VVNSEKARGGALQAREKSYVALKCILACQLDADLVPTIDLKTTVGE
jgi:hypothetical protein